MRSKHEMYQVLDSAIRNPESKEMWASLTELRDELAPGRVVIEVKGPKGTSTTEPMSRKKAEVKASWFKGMGVTVTLLPAPPKARKAKAVAV